MLFFWRFNEFISYYHYEWFSFAFFILKALFTISQFQILMTVLMVFISPFEAILLPEAKQTVA